MSTVISALNGDLKRGEDVRNQNASAVNALANIVRSSLGPNGQDKMLVDELGDINITNDGATILKQLDVTHPAAKILVELSNIQDQEVGDGTTSVVLLAAELLRLGNDLVKQKVHPTSIIAGYSYAKKEACRYIRDTLAIPVDTLDKEMIKKISTTSLSSKILNYQDDFFSNLVVEAVEAIQDRDDDGKVYYPINSINIQKAHGKSALESEMVHGYVQNCVRASQEMPTTIQDAKIALLDIDLRRQRMAMGVQAVINDPTKLQEINDKEMEITTKRQEMIVQAGANVILTTKGIDDTALKYLVSNKVLAVRRCKRNDLIAIAKSTGGRLLSTLASYDNEEENVDESMLGRAEYVYEQRVGNGELIYIKGTKSKNTASIILRGANDYLLDEMERSLHDAMCAVVRCLVSKRVVPGGGCVEGALSIFTEMLSEKMDTREQLAVQAFSQALLIIPKTLSINSALDAIDIVAQLRQKHYEAITDPEKVEQKYMGINLIDGTISNNYNLGVLEPAVSKVKMIRFAVEAAITILRIDDSITMNSKDNPQRPVHDDY